MEVDAIGADHVGCDGGALHERALGGEVAAEKRDRAGEAAFAGARRRHDDLIGIDAVEFGEFRAEARAAFRGFPPREVFAEGATGDGAGVELEETGVAEVEHHLGHAAGEEDLHGGVVLRAIREDVDEARDGAVDARPVVDGGARQAGGVRDGGDVEREISGAAEGRVRDEGVVNRIGREEVARGGAGLFECEEGEGGTPGEIAPDGCARGGERAVREREAEGFGDDLARGGRAHELATAAGRATGFAAHLGGVLEGDFLAGETGREGLDLAGVLGVLGEERDAAGHENGREIGRAGEGEEHRGEALVAGGDAEHAAARGERAYQATEYDGGVVAVGEGVEHAGGAVGAAVAGIADVAGERNRAVGGERARGLLHEQAHFPVAGVVAERDGRAIGRADPALRTKNEELFPEHGGRRPAHAGVLRHAEEIAAGHAGERRGVERERARGAGGGGAQGVDGVGGGEEGGGHG